MKELIVYDFDGVLFKDPWEIHLSLLNKLKEKFPVLRQVILEHGSIPYHLYETEKGREYLTIFSQEYLSQKMDETSTSKLIDFSKKSDLIIASYNKRETVETMLKEANVFNLFKYIFTREDFKRKQELFSRPVFKSYQKVSFVTDTISDIKEAQDSEVNIDIYAVKSIYHKESEFLKYVSQEKIIEPFFKKTF